MAQAPVLPDVEAPTPTTESWKSAPIVSEEKESVGKGPLWASAPKEGTSALDYLYGVGGGVSRGIATVVGAPVDISNMIAETYGGGVEKPTFGSHWIKQQFGKLEKIPGFGDPFVRSPPTLGGRLIGWASEEVGASAVPAAAILKAAGRTASLAPKVLPRIRGFIRSQVLNPVSRAPATATAGEITAATGAGLGAGVSNEALPESKEAETTARLVGGFLPTLFSFTPYGLARRLATNIVSKYTPRAQVAAATKAVRKTVGSLSDDAMKGIDDAIRLSKKVPGFKPSVAEATRNETLILQQEHLDAEASGILLNKAIARRNENKEAIEIWKGSRLTAPDVDPTYVIDIASGRAKTVQDTIEMQTGKVLQKKNDLADSLPTINRIDNGKIIRAGIMEAKAAKSAEMSLMANDLNIDIDLTLQFKGWQNGVKESYKPRSRFEDSESSMPGIVRKIISDKGDKTTFLDIKALRERVSDELLDTIGSSKPNRKLERTLVQLKADIDTFMDESGGAIGEKYQQFRKLYFDEYITPFESGAMFKSKNRDGTGFYRTRDESVADVFLDNPSAANQFNTIFKEDSVMMGQMESAVMDNMRNTIGNDGLISDARLATWLKKNAPILDEFPNIKERVSTVTMAQRKLIDRQKQLIGRKKKVEDISLVKMLNKYSKGDMQVDKILNDALKSPIKMRQLHSLVSRDADASSGLRRTLWDKATSGTSIDTAKFVINNRKSLDVVFSPQHMADIEDVTLMRAMVESVKTPKGTAYIPRPLDELERIMGMKIPQASTRWYALKTGRVAKSYLLFDIGRGILYGKAKTNVESLLRNALYDPQVARTLSESFDVGTITKKAANRLGARAFALGLPFLREDENGR